MTTDEAIPQAVSDQPTKRYVLGDEDEARCLYLVEYGAQGPAEVATSLASALAHFTEPERREAVRRFLRAEARRRRRCPEQEPDDINKLLTRARTQP